MNFLNFSIIFIEINRGNIEIHTLQSDLTTFYKPIFSMFCKSNGLWNHRIIDTHLQAQQSLDNDESIACRMTLITKNSVIIGIFQQLQMHAIISIK